MASPLDAILGESRAICALREAAHEVLHRLAHSRPPPPLVITGERGTGKDMLAECLHRAGPRADAPFNSIVVHAIPIDLMAAELFGCVRGAMDGVHRARPGLFQASHRGTLVLSLAASLLGSRLREDIVAGIGRGAVQRIGGTGLEPADVWVLADWSLPLDDDPEVRRVRNLFDPITPLTLEMPSLREREDDVLLLAEHFLAAHCAAYERPAMTLSNGARNVLRQRDWPGNVRELTNVMERLVVMSAADRLEAEHVQPDWMPSEPLAVWKMLPARRRSRSRARRKS